MKLITEAELAAEILKLTPKKAAERRRAHKWPHVRLGRYDIRYTEAQVQEIVAMESVARGRSGVGSHGQTTRSAQRAP